MSGELHFLFGHKQIRLLITDLKACLQYNELKGNCSLKYSPRLLFSKKLYFLQICTDIYKDTQPGRDDQLPQAQGMGW